MKAEPARRPYRMQRRAAHVDETRLRITEAAVRLHTTIGPANTTIAGIADEAGVTRLTVYRHFADADEVFNACMGHWSAQHPGPDPAAWRSVPDLPSRVRLALLDISAWYEEVADDLAPIERDIATVPQSARDRRNARVVAWIDAIVGDAPDPSGVVRAVVGHVVSIATWRSLVVDQRLDPAMAVDLEVAWVLGAAGRHARPAGSHARPAGRDARPPARHARPPAR